MQQQITGSATINVTLTGTNKELIMEHTEEKDFNITVDVEDSDEIARVKVAAGVTKNMGNFESLRVDVSVDRPALNKKENIEQVFTWEKNWVSKKISEIVAQTQEVRGY